MSLTDRDKKILLVIIPAVAVLAYWFLLLAPKRDEASKAGTELAEQQQKRDDAVSKAARLERAKTTFARDYRDVVRLGKAIPSSVDTPSLIVQLDEAARGTGIKFTKIKAGERAVAASGTQAPSGGSTGSASTPASGGSAPAQSQPGQAAQNANGAASNANQDAANAEKTSADPSAKDAQTSAASKPGGLPVGGGATAGGGTAGATSAAPGLDSVPLEFEFDGSFFDLADFFHRLKRFVRVTNKDVLVRGRLMTIDSMKLASDDNGFPDLTVEVKATVYLSPKTEGTTAGASPDGPATTQTAAASSEGSGSPAASASPTATATP